MKIGYIGLGAMGGALARRLLLSRELQVFDRSADAITALQGLGAGAAATPAAMARDCDIVMMCLPRSANVREVLFGPAGLAEGLTPGKIVVDQTSGDPTETRRMAAELAAAGVAMLDAPVSGGPRGAEAGTIAMMVGGPDETFEKVRPVFDSISPNVFRCGDIGAGQVLKLINNTISTCNRFAMLEGVAMGLANGLDLATMAEVLHKSGARSKATETLLPALVRGEYSANFTLELMLKDLNLATELAMASGAPLQFGQLARGMLQSAANAFGASSNLDKMADLVAAQAGTRFFR
jgi:3-hydroxyisobutyrate dehydrogenase